MPETRRRVVRTRTRTDEILNYFGKCEVCGYPARAESTRRIFDNGEIDTVVVAGCALPCGWSGQVLPTTMTESAATRP